MQVLNHSINLNIFLLVNYFHVPDDHLWQAIPTRRCTAETDHLHSMTRLQIEQTAPVTRKIKLLLKLKAKFVYHTFMVGIMCCLITEGNWLAYYASPVFLNWKRKEVTTCWKEGYNAAKF